MSGFKLRDYQERISNEAAVIVANHGFVYLAMQVRTGKTFTSLAICDKLGASNVLFLTKKKAIGSIESDYNTMKPKFKLTVINYESIHKLTDINYDYVVLDEAHRLSAFPKPGKTVKEVKKVVSKTRAKVILMSGTPTPESFSQMYHQVYFIPGNPFSQYKNFYRFSDDHVEVTSRKIAGFDVRDYSNGKESIMKAMEPYMISYTQEEAGFTSKIEEFILYTEMSPMVKKIISKLKRDKVVEGKDEVILGDTAVKLMNKVHQLCSGTIKFESGNIAVLDTNKAEYIRDNFIGYKLGIFYKFQGELKAIKQIFGDKVTESVEEFNETDKHIALQILSGREGISLAKADYLVYYNIDFSATSYWQSRDRMTTMDRPENTVYWIFAKGGLEQQVYDTVVKKRSFTTKHFNQDII